MVFGCPTGSYAIESPIKFARHNTGRHGMLAFEGSYHGGTAGALSLTASKAYKEGYEPHLNDVVHAPYPNPFREALENDGSAAVCPREDSLWADVVCPVD